MPGKYGGAFLVLPPCAEAGGVAKCTYAFVVMCYCFICRMSTHTLVRIAEQWICSIFYICQRYKRTGHHLIFFVYQVAVPASLLLLGLNVASATVGASIAKSKGRSVPLWVFKGALAGLPSVLELKGLPELVPSSSTGSQDSSGTSESRSSAA